MQADLQSSRRVYNGDGQSGESDGSKGDDDAELDQSRDGVTLNLHHFAPDESLPQMWTPRRRAQRVRTYSKELLDSAMSNPLDAKSEFFTP
jgi:hypothetical protein